MAKSKNSSQHNQVCSCSLTYCLVPLKYGANLSNSRKRLIATGRLFPGSYGLDQALPVNGHTSRIWSLVHDLRWRSAHIIASRSQRPRDIRLSRVPTQSSEETTDMLCTEQRRPWYVSGKPSPRIAGIVLIHLLSPEGVEGGQAGIGIELTMMFLSPGIFAGMVALYKRVEDGRAFATKG
jgi:hypothetical protein